MAADLHVALVLLAVLAAVGIASAMMLFGSKAWFRRRYRVSKTIHKSFVRYFAGGPLPMPPPKTFDIYLEAFARLRDEVVIPKELERYVADEIRTRKLDRIWIARLKSGRRATRMKAIARLCLTGGEDTISALIERIKIEPSPLVRMRIAHELARAHATRGIPAIVETMAGTKPLYRYRIIEILFTFGLDLRDYCLERLSAGDEVALPLALAFGRRFLNAPILEHIMNVARGNGAYAVEAVTVLYERYPDRLQAKEFLENPNPAIRGLAWATFARKADKNNLLELIRAASDGAIGDHVSGAISELVQQAPALLPLLMKAFDEEITENGNRGKSAVRAEILADVLASRLSYFVYGRPSVDRLIGFLLDRKRLAALDSFFAANNAEDIEATLIECLSRALRERPDRRETLAAGLSPAILDRLGLVAPPPAPKRSLLKLGATQKIFLWVLAAAIVTLPLIIFTIAVPIPGEPLFAFIKRYVVSYNRFFAFYSILINSIYLFLLVQSILNIARQFRVWTHAHNSLLFTDRMLSPVSIIVPAFREENSIVDNVQSLLSLNYPQFEIIVVCDGSPDATLSRMIEAFGMERSQRNVPTILPSAIVRGIYRSKRHPYLTLLDKVNGGKADALNAGINFARHDYLCCVDADSLLASDALLKIMYQVIATDKELVACGANIFPVNGCVVRRGSIERYAPPQTPLARFQNVEYLRSFLAGRLGWSRLDSLLIISGAFGIFRRERVLEVGGYLTGESAGRLDTVGEDMELVVRLARHMREQKADYKIGYAFNANCWTEVPEDWGSLWRQRDRWHRGLIEILLYHRGCAFNPRFGTMGLVGLPYFWLFELIGPFLEAMGWIAVAIAFVAGIMNPPLAMLLFVSTIVFGITISTASLAIGEFHVVYFSWRETAKLLAFSMLENFGYRQVMSFSRVTAYFTTLLGKQSWGAMKRKGFSKST
jgi:cellulose synthase/poly-beta-1,6-N-acetylglucosamine synthase-like glycosyltransferase